MEEQVGLIYMLALAWIGMIVHFLKVKMKEDSESLMAILDYFKFHVKSTVVTFLSVTVMIVIMFYQIPAQLTLLSAVSLGYLGDSVINKWRE